MKSEQWYDAPPNKEGISKIHILTGRKIIFTWNDLIDGEGYEIEPPVKGLRRSKWFRIGDAMNAVERNFEKTGK